MCDINDKEKRQNIYKFMLKAAAEFAKEPDIFNMWFCSCGYCMTFTADRDNYGIYSIYGCDEDENITSEQPLCTGGVEEIVKYLNDENNIDEVMHVVV